MDGKKVWKKTGFGILFVAACFVSMYILMAFHSKVLLVILAAILLLVTAFLFLNEIFSEKAKIWALDEEEPISIKEAVSTGNDGEFRLKITKHMKDMESTQKEMIDVLKNQNVLLQSQMENMEQAIIMLSEKQSNQTKSVIKFNKENARQLAISERETLEYVMMELKNAIENNPGATVVRAVAEDVLPAAMPEEPVPATPMVEEAAPEVSVMELEEVGDEELFEVSDLPGDDEYIIPEVSAVEETPAIEDIPVPEEIIAEEPVMEDIFAEEKQGSVYEPSVEEPVAEEPTEEFEIPDMPDDIDLSALFEDMAAGAMEETAEEIPAIEDIPVPEEIVAEEEPEPASEPAADPLAGLSGDPNAMMTPEDIAKLLASMGQ